MSEQNQHSEALFDTLSKNKKKRKRKIIRTVLIVIAVIAVILVGLVFYLRHRVEQRFASAAADVLRYDVVTGTIHTVVSGSGALAVASDLMMTHGPDSYEGRVAAVMMGSTETTFYTIAVYFGSAGITRTRHAVPAALAADLTGFLASALAVRLFFGT